MDIENVKTQMRKGMLGYCVLLLLEEPKYSSDIIEHLKAANLIVVEGTLYPLLSRLRKEGLLLYEWIESPQGPPRKYYRLSEQGKEALSKLDRTWQELEATIEILKNKSNTPLEL